LLVTTAPRIIWQDGVNHMWTVSMVQLHPQAVVVCDAAATVELRVKTVQYFQQVEAAEMKARL
jgi:glucosamine-6-phosphate deaminase